MANLSARIETQHIREWYEKHCRPDFLETESCINENEGYVLDPISGLFIRQIFSENINQRLGYLVIDIIVPRPVDFHYHEDVDEVIKIITGTGEARLQNPEDPEKIETVPLGRGAILDVPVGAAHSFRPNKGSFLEIFVACSGILDSSREVCEARFDQYEPWVEYFDRK